MSTSPMMHKPNAARMWGWAGVVLGAALIAWQAGMVPLSTGTATSGQRNNPSKSNSAGAATVAKGDASTDPRFQEPLQLLHASQQALEEVHDYGATFARFELVDDRAIDQTVQLKVRENPFSVYFRVKGGRARGREVVYVTGQNDGKLTVHEGGLRAIAGSYHFSPDDVELQGENRHPITDLGLRNLLRLAIEEWNGDVSSTPEQVEVQVIEHSNWESKDTTEVRITRNVRLGDTPFQLSRLFFETANKLPIGAERYGWPEVAGEQGSLIERYLYTDLTINPGYTDDDFSITNPEYSF